MKKIWLFAAKTYRQHLRSGTFLILTFGLPVLMLITGAIPFFSLIGQIDARLGYVDQTGRLVLPATTSLDKIDFVIKTYADAAAAQAALRQGQIDGYLVIPAGYFQGEVPRYYGPKSPGLIIREALTMSIRQALLANPPDWVIQRFSAPSEITYAARATGEEMGGAGVFIQFITPLGLAIAFGALVLTSTAQMGVTIIEEKDQRAMEMVITSLTARELVTGKVLGITLLAVTQVAVWGVGIWSSLGLMTLAWGDISLNIPWRTLIWAALLGVPGYFLYAVLAAGLGIIAGNREQAGHLSSVLGFLVMLPVYFVGLLINALDGPLALGLTWFPLFAPVMALTRMTLTEVPTWQLIVSLSVLITSVAGSVWLVARIFRAAMLSYGQPLNPRQIWRALRQA